MIMKTTKKKKNLTTHSRNRKPNGSHFQPNQFQKLKKLYTSGSAAFGSKNNLVKASGLSSKTVERFLETQNAYTKYRSYRRNFPRLKVIVNDLNEIWSLDLAYVDKLAKYNNNVKYLLVAVDCLSRFVRVQPLKTKFSKEVTEAFRKKVRFKSHEPRQAINRHK